MANFTANSGSERRSHLVLLGTPYAEYLLLIAPGFHPVGIDIDL
jgi:hypothetical protein